MIQSKMSQNNLCWLRSYIKEILPQHDGAFRILNTSQTTKKSKQSQGRIQDLLCGRSKQGRSTKCRGGLEEKMEIRYWLDVFWRTTKIPIFKWIICINTGKSRHSCEERSMVWVLVLVQCVYRLIGLLRVNQFVTKNM